MSNPKIGILTQINAAKLERRNDNDKIYDSHATDMLNIITEKIQEKHLSGEYQLQYELPSIFSTRSNETQIDVRNAIYARICTFYTNQGFKVKLYNSKNATFLILNWLSDEKRNDMEAQEAFLRSITVEKIDKQK
jgi:hypothetical protein